MDIFFTILLKILPLYIFVVIGFECRGCGHFQSRPRGTVRGRHQPLSFFAIHRHVERLRRIPAFRSLSARMTPFVPADSRLSAGPPPARRVPSTRTR